MARMTPAWSVAFAFVAFAAGAALGQDSTNDVELREDYEEISASDFRKLPAGTPAGKKYTIHYLKFNKLFGQDLKLFGGFHDGRPIRSHLHGLLKVEGTRLRAKLVANLKANKDSDGKTLSPKKTNIQVFGVVKKTSKGNVLEVNRVHALESFEERFQEEYAKVPEGDAQARLDLVRSIGRAVRFFPEEEAALEGLVASLKKEARAAELDQLAGLPDGLDSHIAFAKRHDDIELLDKAYKHEGVSEEGKARIAKVLREDLGARQLLGVWYGFDAYKKRLGFAKDELGAWVPQERLDLLRAAAEEKKRRSNLMLTPKVPPKLLAVAAKKGDVVAGMPKDMVVAAKRGFPVRVTRVREKISRGTLLWAQWIMEDGSKVYFCNGFAFKKEAAGG